MKRYKRYLPIKIFSIYLSYGWWWGKYFFFFKRFAIIPCWLHLHNCTYEHGKAIENGDTFSWSKSRQIEKEEDKKRHHCGDKSN